MPVLTIDNKTIEVPEGTSVLEAAKILGIYIPHLCFHEGLGAVGSCRLVRGEIPGWTGQRYSDVVYGQGPGRYGGFDGRSRSAGDEAPRH